METSHQTESDQMFTVTTDRCQVSVGLSPTGANTISKVPDLPTSCVDYDERDLVVQWLLKNESVEVEKSDGLFQTANHDNTPSHKSQLDKCLRQHHLSESGFESITSVLGYQTLLVLGQSENGINSKMNCSSTQENAESELDSIILELGNKNILFYGTYENWSYNIQKKIKLVYFVRVMKFSPGKVW